MARGFADPGAERAVMAGSWLYFKLFTAASA